MPAIASKSAQPITIQRLKDAYVQVEIEGLSPYMAQQWSFKSRRGLPGHPDKPTTRQVQPPHVPLEDAEEATYRLPDGRAGVPATAFKSAMVDACRYFKEPSMKEARTLFHVVGEGPQQLVPLEGEPTLREDTPRNADGNANLRYRFAFYPWRATLTIRYIEARITGASVVALIDAAGRVGVGEWRPGSPHSNTGTFGTFRVVSEEISKNGA